jgi:predicted MFS family arabinose efflux permease
MVAGAIAQVTQGAASVGIILVVRQHRGALALAGAVVGSLWIAAGIARPIQGRLIDRRGPAEVMAACGVAHAAALVGIVGFSRLHVSGSVLVALGVVAGLALPPVSTSMRVVWADAVAYDEHTAAYSLVYLIQELAILAGPLILAAMVASFSASVALIAVAGLAAVGALGFAASVQTPTGLRTPSTGPKTTVLRIRGVRLLLPVALLLGGVIGGIQVAAPTLAGAHHKPAAAGLLIAALSIGGIIGATVYGTRRWRYTPSGRLPVLLTALTIAVTLTAAARALVLIGALLLVAGVALNPAITTFSLLIDEHVTGRTAGEAFGWLSTAIASGTGGGSAIAAAVAQHHHDARAAFTTAAIAAAAATAIAVATRHNRPRPNPCGGRRPGGRRR